MTNTWGTMSDKAGVLREMRRLSPARAPPPVSILAGLGIRATRWYQRLEQPVLEVGDEYILTQQGFRSEHFSADRLRSLVGDCAIRPLSDLGMLSFSEHNYRLVRTPTCDSPGD